MKDINSQDLQKNSLDILAKRTAEGVIKEFPLKSSKEGLVLRVKMPPPKEVDAYMRTVLKKQQDGEKLKAIDAETGFQIQDYYLGLFEQGLMDGWTLDKLLPEEYADVKAGVMDFFGQTARKDGTKEPIIQNGEIVLEPSQETSPKD